MRRLLLAAAVTLGAVTYAPGVAGAPRTTPAVGGILRVEDNTVLARLDLPALANLGGYLHVADSLLTSLNLPALTSVAGFNLEQNETLAALGLPALRTVDGDIRVYNNAELATCQARAVVDRLVAAGWTGDAIISGNNDAGTCP